MKKRLDKLSVVGYDEIRKDKEVQKTQGGKKMKATVTNYSLKARNGRHIRQATKVLLADVNYEIAFIEKMGKKEAVNQAICHYEKHALENVGVLYEKGGY